MAGTLTRGYTFGASEEVTAAKLHALVDDETVSGITSDSYVVREKFHLEPIGRFRTIQIEIINSDKNISPIKVYGYNIISFQEAFENE